MAVSYTVERREVEGRLKVLYGLMVFGAADVSATVAPADLGLKKIQELRVFPTAGYVGSAIKVSLNEWTVSIKEEEAVAAGGPLLETNDDISAIQVRYEARGW